MVRWFSTTSPPFPHLSTPFNTFQQLTTEHSLLCVFMCFSFFLFHFFTHHRIITLNYIFIYSLYFFSLIPRAYSPLSPTRASCLSFLVYRVLFPSQLSLSIFFSSLPVLRSRPILNPIK